MRTKIFLKFAVLPALLVAGFFVGVNLAGAAPAEIIAGNTSSAFNNWQKNFSWKHTIATSTENQILLVTLHGDGNYINTVSYNGQALALAAKRVIDATYNNLAVYIYYLVNPPPGEYNITVSASFSVPIIASAITFSNCEVTNPINSAEVFYGTASSLPHNIATTNSDTMVVDAVTYNKPQAMAIAPGPGQMQYFSNYVRGQTNDLYSGESYKLAEEAGLQTMSWTTPEARSAVHAIIALNPSNSKLDPVILVPGIMGSYLNHDDLDKDEVWPNILKMMIPGDDSYLNELAMETNGYPDLDNPMLKPEDIIREIFTSDFFQGLITELENNGYKEGRDLFVFPYDWRWFINWSAGEDPFTAIQSLAEKINEVKTRTGTEKVNIIAHSMGGIVAKYYIKHYGNNSVNKFIDIATPHLGSVDAFKTLMYGNDLDLKIGFYYPLNKNTIKTISQNIPSIYQLLPSRNYFDETDQNYSYYIYDEHDLDNNGIKGSLDFDQSIEFMKNMGRNEYLLNFNDSLHNDLDNYSPKQEEIKTYNIIGCSSPTIGKIFALNKEESGGHEYRIEYINGDGTVPLRSSDSLLNDGQFYVKNIKHSNLPSADGVKEYVSAILQDKTESFFYINYANLTPYKSNCNFSGTQISFHSPIELHVYDEDDDNHHLGPNQDGDIEMGIAGAQYDIIEGNKFVFLPLGHSYKIVGQATNVGTFNARIQNVMDGEYTQTVYYNEIPLNTINAKAQINISDNQQNYILDIDENGDQIFETQVEPDSILNRQESEDLIKPETQINPIGTLGSDNWYISDVKVSLTAIDNQDGSGILKTEYSLDNGQNWNEYNDQIILNQNGQYSIWYKSTDRAGNVEEIKTQDFKIDKTGPIINILIPIENQEFLHSDILIPEYLINDYDSGVASDTIAVYIDGQLMQDNQVDLFSFNLSSHTLKITVRDKAGNISELAANFIVITTIDSTISDIERSYSQGWIKNKVAKDWLIRELQWIESYIEKFGQRQNKLDQKFEDMIKKCEEKQSVEWCKQKLGSLFDIVVYKLNNINKKIIVKQYQMILKQLDLYYRKQWIIQPVYDIIKADINYLINNL